MAAKLGVISLGCPKNRVDTEVMLGLLEKEGYEFVQDLHQADIALINTCAFTTDAKEEAINTILEAEQQKRFGKLKGIVVTGCLPQRYQGELHELLPRVDSFLGVAAYRDIVHAVREVEAGHKLNKYDAPSLPDDFHHRLLTTVKPTAYVKISEGCDNRCTYCVIPQLRGGLQSRDMDDVLREIEELAKDGYSEIVLVAQDTTKYGVDRYGEARLPELLDRAAQIPGLKWLRFLYSYPDSITDELLEVMMRHDNIVKYIDMPVQHMDDDILKRMNRKGTYETIADALRRIRQASPDIVVRSTVIVGFPGETREQMAALTDRVREAKFAHLGIFSYSPEEGTPAAELPGQVNETEKEFRRDALHNLQAPISFEANHRRLGRVYDVLIEGKDANSGYYYGRSYAQAPEVDGKIFVKSDAPLEAGWYYPVRLTVAHHYDSIGEVAKGEEEQV